MLVPFVGRSPTAEEDVTGSTQLLRRHYEIVLKAAVMFVARGARYRVSSGLECGQVAPGHPGVSLAAFVVSRMASQATRARGGVIQEGLEAFCMF
jgi:hypothetical protein